MRNSSIFVLALLCACVSLTPPSKPVVVGPYPNAPVLHAMAVIVKAPDGTPIAGAEVTVSPRVLGAAVAFPTTNQDGYSSQPDVPQGDYTIQVKADGYVPLGLDLSLIQNQDVRVTLTPVIPPLSPLTTEGPIFLQDGKPWRWKGVTAFKLLDRFTKGEDVTPYFEAFKGFNLVRVFLYVTWPGVGWEPPELQYILAFLERCRVAGFYVELVLLTDDDRARIEPAKRLVQQLAAANPPNLVIEVGNEPTAHKNIDTAALRDVLERSPFLYASGDGDARFYGRYLTAHTPRDGEWPRKSHDLLEYYHGGGPSAPTDPAHHVPIVADEPIRPDEAGFVDRDFLAYFASASLLGAGATFHFEGGKLADLPTIDEARCAAAALKGLEAFPPDAPRGGYQRIDEQGATLRTYKVGPYMVRIRPSDGNVLPKE